MERTRWYKKGVYYQIWCRSFKDGNGDGMGDLYGVLEKLDYIKSLGVDGIWFNPIYPSPGADCGYDIADYTDIAPEFGGMEAFRKVMAEAHKRGLRVIMDLVINHTSDEHEWFQKSRQRIDPYTDYYFWSPKIPNNWDSHFEGKAWEWDEVRQEYYLHLFVKKQPDLNMDNPLVRAEIVKILNFWMELGVDGFREDVITFISKPEKWTNDYIMPQAKGILSYNFGRNLHAYLQQFKTEAFDRFDYVTIAEAPLAGVKKALEYTAEDGTNEFDMFIQFECMGADCLITDFNPMPFNLKKLKKAWTKWQVGLQGRGWNFLYLENHDHSRIVSRYGSEKYPKESAKMLCTAYMFQEGTPFVYQGQELGMTNWYPKSMDEYEDCQTLNYGLKKPEQKRLKVAYTASRDSARTPFPWTAGRNAGFTDAEKPWFTINPNFTEINAEAEEKDPESVLNFYRKAIALKKEMDGSQENVEQENGRLVPVNVMDGDAGIYREIRKSSGKIYAYERGRYTIVCSFTEKPVRFKAEGKIILSNYKENGETLKPYECRVYRRG